jgi:hypothetical protein
MSGNVIVHLNRLKPYPSTMRPTVAPRPDRQPHMPTIEDLLRGNMELIPQDSTLEGGNSGPCEIHLQVKKQVTKMNTVIRDSKQVATALRMISLRWPKLLKMPHTH